MPGGYPPRSGSTFGPTTPAWTSSFNRYSLRWFWGTRVECNVGFGVLDTRVAGSDGGSWVESTGYYLEYLVGYRIADHVGFKAGVGIPATGVEGTVTPKVLGVVSPRRTETGGASG